MSQRLVITDLNQRNDLTEKTNIYENTLKLSKLKKKIYFSKNICSYSFSQNTSIVEINVIVTINVDIEIEHLVINSNSH